MLELERWRVMDLAYALAIKQRSRSTSARLKRMSCHGLVERTQQRQWFAVPHVPLRVVGGLASKKPQAAPALAVP